MEYREVEAIYMGVRMGEAAMIFLISSYIRLWFVAIWVFPSHLLKLDVSVWRFAELGFLGLGFLWPIGWCGVPGGVTMVVFPGVFCFPVDLGIPARVVVARRLRLLSGSPALAGRFSAPPPHSF